MLLGLSACASPGEPRVAGGSVGVDPVQRSVYWAVARMDFGTQTVALPTTLFVNGSDNILKPKDACPGVESLAGVALYPAVSAVGDIVDGATPAFSVLLQGPAAVRVTSTYSVPYQCDGKQTALTGTSTFTMFPSGRLVRRDENLVASTTTLADSTRCGACSPDPFHFTSFWAFKTAQVVSATGGQPMRNEPACLITDGVMVAVKFNGTDTQAGNFNGGSIFVQDLAPEASSWTSLEPKQARSQLAFEVTTDPARCAALLSTLEDPVLKVNDVVVDPIDGIYDATKETYRGTVRIKAATSHPRGIALRVDLGGATHARVLHDGNATEYQVESDGDHPVFWLAQGLATANEEITIEPLD